MYLDQIEKIKYYRERIASQMARIGQYPDNARVQEQIDKIDTKMSILQFKPYNEGELLDTEQLNENFLCIYHDLETLYKVVYQLSIKRYQEAKIVAETYLAEFEAMARRYEYKNKLETGSTSLGKTVLYQGSGFEPEENNGRLTLNLGYAPLSKGSKVACIFKSEDVSPSNVVFNIGKQKVAPYNVDHDLLVIDGEPISKTFEYKPKDSVRTGAMRHMMPAGLVINATHDYLIFGGKDCVKVQAASSSEIVKHNGSIATVVSTDEKIHKISFYVLNGSYIEFNFSSEPLSKNFNGYRIDNLGKHRKITIEAKGEFAFSYTTDGSVYAAGAKGVVSGYDLCYPDDDDVSDFYIEEYSLSDNDSYEVTMEINSDVEAPRIQMVAIKELSIFDEVEL